MKNSAESERPVRATNVELLRCVLMFFIVLDHCYFHGVFKESTAAWTALFTTAIMWHVDCFVGISGWFGIKFSIKKLFALWAQMLFYSVVSLLFIYFYDRSNFSVLKFRVSGGWFGSTYLFLMLLAPFLNCALEKIVTLNRKEILRMWGLCAIGLFVYWMPFGKQLGMDFCGVNGGYSIVMFVFVYSTVRLIRLLDITISRRKCKLVMAGYFAVVLMLAGFQFLACLVRNGTVDGSVFRAWHSYVAPHVWIMAVAVLMFVISMTNIPPFVARLARLCAPSMFAVYLIHDTTSFGRLIYTVPEGWLAAHTALHPAAIVFASGVLTFIVCVALDVPRRILVSLMKVKL